MTAMPSSHTHLDMPTMFVCEPYSFVEEGFAGIYAHGGLSSLSARIASSSNTVFSTGTRPNSHLSSSAISPSSRTTRRRPPGDMVSLGISPSCRLLMVSHRPRNRNVPAPTASNTSPTPRKALPSGGCAGSVAKRRWTKCSSALYVNGLYASNATIMAPASEKRSRALPKSVRR